MGFRCSFIISKSKPSTLINSLGMMSSLTEEEMPEEGRWCAQLNNTGWTVIFANDFFLPSEAQDQIAKLSEDDPQYICILSETNMSISVSKYMSGKEDWAIDWSGEEGFKIKNLSARGNLPDRYETLKKEAIEAQKLDENVDHIFGIPTLIVKEDTGFRYDDWLEQTDVDEFRILTAIKKEEPKRSFLSKLLGLKD